MRIGELATIIGLARSRIGNDQLSASNRMPLMPFAQISTRIGGASTVIVATIVCGCLFDRAFMGLIHYPFHCMMVFTFR